MKRTQRCERKELRQVDFQFSKVKMIAFVKYFYCKVDFLSFVVFKIKI